jgi:imidazolonepropionase-like amidohydrolase
VGLLDEMEMMERAGLPSQAVVQAATGTGSNRLAFKEKLGQIKSGFQSRFILTRHSPLETVSNLQKQKTVVFDGEVYECDEKMDASGL